MSTVNEIFGSTRNRGILLRKRTDLTVVKQVYRSEPFWLIKDPLEMEFYRLNEEEYAILEMLDGKTSLDEIKSAFERRFAPQRITYRQLQVFISDLRKKSLLAFTQDDVGPQLVEREQEKQIEKLKKGMTGILAIKWRGVDPDRFLDFVTPKVGWIFSAPAVVSGLLLVASAIVWLVTHYEQFVAKLPGLQMFLAQENWLLLAGTVVVMKIFHELAHGISFKRFGGECHEIGIMLLIIVIPTLYCSTTDSWLLKSKWKRAAIGAAGMYIEILIAAIATFGWWFTQPGTINMICLNIMVTGSISVILLNGNPFFKFDGYYILSDVFELPNLLERAGKQFQSWFLYFALGIDEPVEINSRLSTKIWLITYKISAFLFKIFVIILIKFMLIDRLNPIGLGYLGLVIGVIAIIALLGPPTFSLYKFFKVPGRLHRIEMRNAILFGIFCALIGTVIFLIPFPHHVNCSFTIQPRDGHAIYVEHEAHLKKIHVEPGQHVKAGQLIAELENLDDSFELSQLQTEAEESQAELDLLEQTRESSVKISKRIAELRESIQTNHAKMKELEEIIASFKVAATRDGQIIPEWTNIKMEKGMELVSFDGSLFSDRNLRAWLPSGQKLCTIGDLTQFDAVLAVNEHDVSFLAHGQKAVLMLDSLPGQRIENQIDSIAFKESDDVPKSLTRRSGGNISIQQSESEKISSVQTIDEHFEARVGIPQTETKLCSGLRGTARIRVGKKTLFQRITLLVYRSFRKKLN